MFTMFWRWYEKNKTLNLGIATFLFALQIVHLIWLTGDVVVFKLTGYKVFDLHHNSGSIHLTEIVILIVDYLEIPAIVTASLVYINELRKKYNFKSLLYLFFINSQFLHIFWITDEFVIDMFTGNATTTVFPFWLAWVAILIDYLELPVIYDTLKRFFGSLKKEGITPALEELRDE